MLCFIVALLAWIFALLMRAASSHTKANAKGFIGTCTLWDRMLVARLDCLEFMQADTDALDESFESRAGSILTLDETYYC
jgi:hypothetical protein